MHIALYCTLIAHLWFVWEIAADWWLLLRDGVWEGVDLADAVIEGEAVAV